MVVKDPVDYQRLLKQKNHFVFVKGKSLLVELTEFVSKKSIRKAKLKVQKKLSYENQMEWGCEIEGKYNFGKCGLDNRPLGGRTIDDGVQLLGQLGLNERKATSEIEVTGVPRNWTAQDVEFELLRSWGFEQVYDLQQKIGSHPRQDGEVHWRNHAPHTSVYSAIVRFSKQALSLISKKPLLLGYGLQARNIPNSSKGNFNKISRNGPESQQCLQNYRTPLNLGVAPKTLSNNNRDMSALHHHQTNFKNKNSNTLLKYDNSHIQEPNSVKRRKTTRRTDFLHLSGQMRQQTDTSQGKRSQEIAPELDFSEGSSERWVRLDHLVSISRFCLNHGKENVMLNWIPKRSNGSRLF
jgi:hypothetical protein